MKNIKPIILLLATTIGWTACDSEQIHYEGPNYVMFTDSLFDMPITEDAERTFDVQVGTTQATDYDRYYAVDVDLTRTNAIEGYHFDILSRNVLIKAGERTGKVTLKGHYDHLNANDSLAVTFTLLNLKEEQASMYNNWANVRLHKCMPFNIEDYVGDVRMTCTFPFSTSQVTSYLLKTEKKNDSTLIVKAPFDEAHDLTLKFHTAKNNPFDTTIDMVEQTAFTDSYYGEVAMATIDGIDSYYLPADRAFVLILNVFIPKVGAFGNYYYIFEWVKSEQAEAEKNGLTTPY